MPNTVVFRSEVNAYDKNSFWRDKNAVTTYLEQNYGELKLIYYIDEPHGSMHRCAAVVRFRDCNVANHVKQRYNGRPLFGTRVTTTWLTMKQMKELGMVPCDDETDSLPRDKAFVPQQQGEPFYSRDNRYARHMGGLSLSEKESTSEKGTAFGSPQTSEGSNSMLSPAWGASVDWKVCADSPEGQRFPSPHMAFRGGRGIRGFRRGWGKAPRGKERGPPILPRKHELMDKGKGSVSLPPAKCRSKKRLFGPSAYVSPPSPKRPRRFSHPTKELSPDAERTIFDRLSPLGGIIPPEGGIRDGSPLHGDGSGDEAFVRELPVDTARISNGEEVGVERKGRGFSLRNDRQDQDVAGKKMEGVGNWSPVGSSQGGKTPDHPGHSNWSPIHSSKDGWSSDSSPDHSIKAKQPFKVSDLPSRTDQSPGHQSQAEVATDDEVAQSPDHPGTPGLSPGHLEEPATPADRTVEEKTNKYRPHGRGHLDKEINHGPLDRETDKSLHSIDGTANRKVSCHGSRLVVEEHAICGTVASTSGLEIRCGQGDGVTGEEVLVSCDAQQTEVKASIIKEFDLQASMLAKSCKLLICDNSDQSKVIMASLTNSLMKLAEKLALKFQQHSNIQQRPSI